MARFFRRGISKIYWLPAVAGTSPTRSEINAGIDLSPIVQNPAGFEINNVAMPAPNLAERFTPTDSGPDEVAGDTAIVCYDDDDTATLAEQVRAAMAKGEEGFVFRMPYGDVATKRCEVWPARVAGLNDLDYDMGNTHALFRVRLNITSEPELEGVIPAA